MRPPVYTAQWRIAGIQVLGPDQVDYQGHKTTKRRLDGRPHRQGDKGMTWKYSFVPGDVMVELQNIWRSFGQMAVYVDYLDTDGEWKSELFNMSQPNGRRETVHWYDVTIAFVPVYYTGTGIQTSAGSIPSDYPGWSDENPNPVASIGYTASVVGDPQIVINLDGRGSYDPDGMIVSYSWSDNTDAFRELPDYPIFNPPHEANTAQCTFVYEYVEGMPNPLITLTVTDNAGLTGEATVEVNIASLLASLPTKGLVFLLAVNGSIMITYDGGLSFEEVYTFTNATCVAGAGSRIIIGCSDGRIYWVANTEIQSAHHIATFDPGESVVGVAVAQMNPMFVAALSDNGVLAYSRNGGLSFSFVPSPLTTGTDVFFNQNIANEIFVSGPNGTYRTRNWGATWETEMSGITGSAAIRGATRLKYAATDSGLFATSDVTWVATEALGNITALSQLINEDNDLIIGDADGVVTHVTETSVQTACEIGAPILDIERHPDNPSIVLIATEAGLYKTMNNAQSAGELAFPGERVDDIDFLRVGGSVEAEVIFCCGGGLDVAGVWFHQGDQWHYRSNGLPDGLNWYHVIADPYNKEHWAVYGNAPGYSDFEQLPNGMVRLWSSDISPIWETYDAGLTWSPVDLYLPSHLGHTDHIFGNCVHADIEYASVKITDMEFDRTSAMNLFVFGYANTNKTSHGIVWKGTGGYLVGNIGVSTKNLHIPSRQSVHSYFDNDCEMIVSGEGGPDGSIVFLALNRYVWNAHTNVYLQYQTPDGSMYYCPTPPQLYAAQAVTEREPIFNSKKMVSVYRRPENDFKNMIHVYATADYQTSIHTLKAEIEDYGYGIGKPAEAPDTGNWLSMTYTINGIWIAGGMGLLFNSDPFTEAEYAIEFPDTYFTAVRCDRQWRKSIAAMAFWEKQIYIRRHDGLDWTWKIIPLPPGVDYTAGGIEITGL